MQQLHPRSLRRPTRQREDSPVKRSQGNLDSHGSVGGMLVIETRGRVRGLQEIGEVVDLLDAGHKARLGVDVEDSDEGRLLWGEGCRGS